VSYPYLIAFNLSGGEAFRIEIDHFIAQIRTEWPSVTVRTESCLESRMALEWDMYMENYPLTGRISREDYTVIIDADLSHAARFASWYRTIIPPEYMLLFFSASWDRTPVEIGVGATSEQIIELYNSDLS
jgi:hypothetical protein